MSNISRFQFPSFVTTENKDTATHEVEIGRLRSNDNVFVLTMIRNGQFLDLPFVVAKVQDAVGKVLWAFPHENFDGVGLLAEACGEVVVALTGKGQMGKVERVIPLSKLVSSQSVDLRRKIWFKVEAAKFLGRDYVFSTAENIVLKADIARKDAEQEAARITAAEARVAARHELVNRIFQRDTLQVYTADGSKRFGVPVVEAEWSSLPNGTYVVLVDSVDLVGENYRIGNVIEAFRVLKERGRNPQKGYAASVMLTKPTTSTQVEATGVKSIGSTVVEMPGGIYEVVLYNSMDDIRQARKAGLNGGTLVAVRVAPKAKVEVYSVHHDHMDTLGQFLPLA